MNITNCGEEKFKMFLKRKVDTEQECSISFNVWRLGGRFNAAKPLLYEVPTYLAGCPIGGLNRKTKRKKSDGKI